MSNQTKMLIITTNADLIGQLSSKKCKDTRIINLDEENSISKDNSNLFDLTFLAQLSEFNSTNDQMYKRVLDCPQNNRSKTSKISKKFCDLVCVICGDCAIGFNYDVLTCASCKAFFRRNAQHHPDKLRCLTGQKKCSVSHNTHRKCQRCRLEKCLSVGMRKDFIVTEEKKQKRRQRLEENRQLSKDITSPSINESIDEIDRLLMDTDENEINSIQNCLNDGLSIEDWSDIEHIRSSYSSIFEIENCWHCSFDVSDRTSALISWSERVNQQVLKLIQFFRQIDEFENLNADDRFILIKYNLLALYLVQKCHNYNLLTGSFGHVKDEERIKRRQFFQLCYGTSGIRESFKSLMQSLSIVTQQDLILINLLLIILLFSKGLSMNENEPLLKDTLAIHRAQSYYIRLTWNYLLYKHGEEKTTKQFVKLLAEITRIQSIMTIYRDFFRGQFQSKDAFERFPPLMQAVLDID